MKYAVVTGANKGIGLEICRQLVLNGVKVVLTARNEKRGLEALHKLRASGLTDPNLVLFHQLDVVDSASVAALADFLKTQFGKLDILVNNAGIMGALADDDALRARTHKDGGLIKWSLWSEIITQPYEIAEECLQTNYYGAKRMTEAFIPLLQLSDSPRIINVSSSLGKLENISNQWAVRVLSDAERLTEEKVDEVLREFLKDFRENSIETKGWPASFSAYMVSKAAMNAYTRIMAKKFPSFRINSVCPGYTRTDINFNTGFLKVEEAAASPVRVALFPNDSPSGIFYIRHEVSPF